MLSSGVLSGLLMRPENNEAENKAEARQCEAENEAEAKELLWGRGQKHEAEAKR